VAFELTINRFKRILAKCPDTITGAGKTAKDRTIAELIAVVDVPMIEVAATMTEIVMTAETMIVADLVLQAVTEVILEPPKYCQK
jgi:hypothetical protein